MDKRPNEQQSETRIAQSRGRNMNPICIEFRRSRFFSAMKYPIFYIKTCGLHLESDCIHNVATLERHDAQSPSPHFSDPEVIEKEIDTVVREFPENGVTPRIKMANDAGFERKVCTNSDQNNLVHIGVYKVKPASAEEINGNNQISTFFENNKQYNCQCCYKQYFKWLVYFFCFAVVLLHVCDICRLVSILPGAFSDDNNFVYSLANVTFKLLTLFLNVTSCYVSRKHYLPMCYLWLKYEQKYGLSFNAEHFKKWFVSLMVLAWTVTTIVVGTHVVEVLTMETNSYFRLWPFDLSDWTHRCTAAFLFGVTNLLGCCATFSAHTLRGAILEVLLEEFQALQDKFTKILSNTADPVKANEDFHKFVEQLRVITEIMDKCFDVVKHTISAAYFFPPIIVCLVLYDWASGSLTWTEAMLTVYTVIIGVFMIATTTKLCGRVRTKGQAIWAAVYKVPWCSVSPTMMYKLSIFMQQLSVTDFGYSVYGLFIVDYSSLMMVGGTILTYGIFVLQLKLDNNNPTACVTVNKTG